MRVVHRTGLAAAIGAAFELLAVRPVAGDSPLRIIMVTIGGAVVLRQVALHIFGPDERALAPFTEGASLKAFGAAVELQTLWVWGLTALAVVALALLYRKTSFGRAMRATAIRRDAARLVGVNAGMMVTVAFALAAGLGALAGVAVAPLTQTAFFVGAAIGVKGFAAAILGGIGKPMSAVAGGLLLGLLESLAAGYLNPAYKDGVALVVLLVVLFVAPQGLLGKARRVKV